MESIPAMKPSEIDVSKISFKEIKKSENIKGYASCGILYNNKPLCIQTPVSLIPYSPKTQKEFNEMSNEKADEEGGSNNNNSNNSNSNNDNKLDLTISFGENYKTNEKMMAFYNKVEEIQEHVIKTAVSMKKEWFGDDDEYNAEDSVVKIIVQTKFSKMIKRKRKNNVEYPPTIKFKIPFDTKTQKYMTDFFDMKTKEKLVLEDIRKNMGLCDTICIVRMSRLWFAGGKFGVTMELDACKVKLTSNVSKHIFQDDSDTEKENPVEADDDDVQAVTKQAKDLTVADSEDTGDEDEDNELDNNSDDDTDDDEDLPPAPAPAPAAAKKTAAASAKKTTTGSKKK